MYKRSLECFTLCIVLFFISILRVAGIATGQYSEKTENMNGISLTVTHPRGTIYDCNGVRLTNDKETIIAAVSPTPRAITAIKQVLTGKELEDVLEKLKENKPVLCEVPERIECDGIVCTRIFETDNLPAKHLLGYCDTDAKGISGIEAAYNDVLYTDESISVFYETDGKGRILAGIEPIVTNKNFALTNGVITTLDVNIQTITEKYAEHIQKGAVVVAEAQTGKIRASVSRPDFQTDNISDYLTDETSPLLNRATNAYSVGSVFKPCVAAAGIENGNGGFTHNCTGKTEIIDRYFRCHKWDGHGLLDLQGALAFSCNTYFYDFASNIGKNEIYKTAKALSFGQSLTLCNGINTASGSLPDKNTLSNIAHLANFSIGQGELSLSPISVLPLYCSIASGGSYYIPSVVEGTSANGEFTPYNIGAPTKVMSESTAAILRDCLKSVLSEGTGEKARPKTVTAAGKTATAQTGKIVDGKEIDAGWFCGFFPAENPKYVVVVFSEDITKQDISCAEIFANIADDITALN